MSLLWIKKLKLIELFLLYILIYFHFFYKIIIMAILSKQIDFFFFLMENAEYHLLKM